MTSPVASSRANTRPTGMPSAIPLMTTVSVCVPTASAMYTTAGRKKASRTCVLDLVLERSDDDGRGHRAEKPDARATAAGARAVGRLLPPTLSAHRTLPARKPPRRARSSSCSSSRVCRSRALGASPRNRPSPSTTATVRPPRRAAARAAASRSDSGATMTASSVRSPTGTGSAAESNRSIGYDTDEAAVVEQRDLGRARELPDLPDAPACPPRSQWWRRWERWRLRRSPAVSCEAPGSANRLGHGDHSRRGGRHRRALGRSGHGFRRHDRELLDQYQQCIGRSPRGVGCG